jgi:hypothetical protein
MISNAKTIRLIQEEHPFHAVFLLGSMKTQAVKNCGCNKLSCDLCGMARLYERARRIEHHSKIAMGYLTGGVSNKALK